MVFRFPSTTLITRVLEGEFPPYERVIPPQQPRGFSCAKEPLVSAIRRVSLMTTTASQAVVFECASGRLTLSKDSPELGSVREELPVSYDGEATTMAFNPAFWLEVLRTFEEDDVRVELAGADRPAVIRLPEFTYVALPMKMAP